MIPVINTAAMTRVFSSRFLEEPGAFERDWNIEDLHDGWHQVGNLDANGNALPGRRWAAHYDAFHGYTSLHDMQRGLGLAAWVDDRPDSERESYLDPRTGQLSDAAELRIYLPWIQSARPMWSESERRHIVDPGVPGSTFLYGYFEVEFDASEFPCPGCRFSVWLMPAADLVRSYWGLAYDDDAANGHENDLMEIEQGGRFSNHLLVKNIAGDAGQTPGGLVALNIGDLPDVPVDLEDGQPHVLGHLWTPEGHVWFIDGHEIQRDTDLVSHVPSMLVMSREANTGVIDPAIDPVPSEPRAVVAPKRPRDPGLYGDDVFQHLDSLLNSVMWIRRVEAWQADDDLDYPALLPSESDAEPSAEPVPEPPASRPEPPPVILQPETPPSRPVAGVSSTRRVGAALALVAAVVVVALWWPWA